MIQDVIKEVIKQSLTLRVLTPDDLDEFNKLLRYAFQITQNELAKTGYDDEQIKIAKKPILNQAIVYGYFEEKNLVSQLAVYPMQMNIYGKIYAMGGITGVATYPEFNSMGLVKSLMKVALKAMRDNHQSISCLCPYSISYYRSRGWEIVSDKMSFSLKDSQLPNFSKPKGIIKRLPSNHQDILSLHDQFAKQTHGCAIRNELLWEEYWRWEVDDIAVAAYYDKDNQPKGYIVYLLEDDVFKIKEMISLNHEAMMGLWSFVAAHKSMFSQIIGSNYTSQSLAFLLGDGEIKESIAPFIMARIVDVKQFLTQFRFDKIPIPQKFSFIVEDDLLEWNNGVFSLYCGPNKVKINHTPLKRQVRLNIQTLTTMLLGYQRPSYLKQIGRIKANQETIEILEDILPEGKVYFSDYF